MEIEQKKHKGVGSPPCGHPSQFSYSIALGILCLPCEMAGVERALLLSPGWALVWGGVQSSEGSRGARHVKRQCADGQEPSEGFKDGQQLPNLLGIVDAHHYYRGWCRNWDVCSDESE